jgi:hypothetical protein
MPKPPTTYSSIATATGLGRGACLELAIRELARKQGVIL